MMNTQNTDPKTRADAGGTFEVMPDVTPRREGGDDAIAETNPADSRMDEFVIVNQQEANQVVNGSVDIGAEE